MLHVDLSGMHIKPAFQFLQYSQNANLLNAPRKRKPKRKPKSKGINGLVLWEIRLPELSWSDNVGSFSVLGDFFVSQSILTVPCKINRASQAESISRRSFEI